jgi:hypothetical protein
MFYDGEKRLRAQQRFRRCLGQRTRNRVVTTLGGFQHGTHAGGT